MQVVSFIPDLLKSAEENIEFFTHFWNFEFSSPLLKSGEENVEFRPHFWNFELSSTLFKSGEENISPFSSKMNLSLT